jgi:hypothetical protein
VAALVVALVVVLILLLLLPWLQQISVDCLQHYLR